MKTGKLRVAITHGDINGIGYEVILKALSDTRMLELCAPVIYGAAKVAAYYKRILELNQIHINTIATAENILPDKINLINCVGDDIKVEVGKPTEAAGIAAYQALEAAVTDIRKGLVDVIVTAPINKHTIHSEQFNFPGHTEYLQDRLGDGDTPLMILMNDKMRVALVTMHIPVSEISRQLTQEAIQTKLAIFRKSIREDFAIEEPRIAVLSLNPHAGDDGLLGSEETEIIIPAIEESRKNGIMAFGPYPSDGFFGAATYTHFDGVLAMYHDQGLAPFKTISMDDGVNYTAGLPFVRTSPDHGTAYDIAGKNVASENSMRQAIYTAIDVYRNRRNYSEMTANPLKKQYVDKGGKDETINLIQETEQ